MRATTNRWQERMIYQSGIGYGCSTWVAPAAAQAPPPKKNLPTLFFVEQTVEPHPVTKTADSQTLQTSSESVIYDGPASRKCHQAWSTHRLSSHVDSNVLLINYQIVSSIILCPADRTPNRTPERTYYRTPLPRSVIRSVTLSVPPICYTDLLHRSVTFSVTRSVTFQAG